jgi:hypothetical protein
MGTIASVLLALAGPMALRVLTLLGVGVVTFTGVTTGLQALISQAESSWATIPAAMLALASIAGVPQALGIVAGAIVARVSLWATLAATRWVLNP